MIVLDQRAPDWAHQLVAQLNRELANIRPDSAVAITGGAIDGTPVGQTTKAAGSFTTLTATQTAILSTTQVAGLTSTQLVTVPGGATALLAATAALSNGASTQVGTLNTSPVAGNPTKWVAINDAGVTRFIPCW